MENGTGEEEEGGGGGEVAHSCFGRDPLHALKTTARSGRRGAKTNTHSASTDLSNLLCPLTAPKTPTLRRRQVRSCRGGQRRWRPSEAPTQGGATQRWQLELRQYQIKQSATL